MVQTKSNGQGENSNNQNTNGQSGNGNNNQTVNGQGGNGPVTKMPLEFVTTLIAMAQAM